uniref:Major facilitator superfamily (MFS) profile domain-containing protein n=1 Tax=Stomoxys calcitrans TaxID=35570 RepID=A0A1I8QEU2_STOCA
MATAPSTFVIIGAAATNNQRQNRGKNGCCCCNPIAAITLIPDIFIFFSAGMNLALGLGWDYYSTFGPVKHFRFSWFIGVIAGALLALLFRLVISKQFIRVLAKILILAEGILFTSAPYDEQALLAGRYLNGIAVGLSTIIFLLRASEISPNHQRGSCLAIEQYCISVGIAIQMIYTSQWADDTRFPANRLHGILDIIFAACAIASAGRFGSIESPVDWLWKGQETAAWECLVGLQYPNAADGATKIRLEELTEYVRYEANLSLMDDIKRGALPLVKMIFFRSMILAFSFSLPLSLILQHSSDVNYTTWPAIVAGCLRIFGGFIAQMQIDFLGRKSPALFCSIVVGAFVTGIGGICADFFNLQSVYEMSVVTTLCLLIQFFAGCFAPFTSAFLGEAFPWILKPYFMAVVVVMEQIIHIIVICTFWEFNSGLFLAPGILIIVVSMILAVTMPETRNTSLMEAQGRFRNLIYFKAY